MSSFDSTTDLIGWKEGYGDGAYSLYPANDAPVFGDDFTTILKHFETCRGTRPFNQKKDVSPIVLKAYLPWISLVEPILGGDGRMDDARVTLHGSAVAGAYSEITHKRVREVHQPDVADRVIASMQHAIDIRSPVIGVSDERHVEPPVRLHILYVPLSADGETVNLFLSYVRLDPLD